MAFQIKNFTSIVASMLNHVRATAPSLTDYNVGGKTRTLLEAPAMEIEEAYQQTFNSIKDGIPVATYDSFNFSRLPAAPATGLIRVVVAVTAVNVVIPAGTVFQTEASRTTYVSQETVTILAGQSTGDVSVVASQAGLLGNIAAGKTFSATPAIANFTSASNLKLFSNGRNLESDDERKQRFVAFIEAIQRATVNAVEYGATTAVLYNAAGVEIERVASANVVEPYLLDVGQPISLVNLFVHNGVGSTSNNLLDRVREIIKGYVDPTTGAKVPGWKAAGVNVVTAAATEVELDMVGVITAKAGYVAATLATEAEDVLTKYILSLGIGESFLRSRAVILVSEIAGVANIVFSDPTADVAVDPSEKLMPGTVSIT